MDKRFNRMRYGGTAISEYGSNITRRCRIIASMIPAYGKFLDLGCWDSSLAREYTRNNINHIKIYGADLVIHPSAMNFYDKTARVDLGKDRFPFDTGTFDCIVNSDLIEHVFDTDHLIIESRRVLKKSGVMVITTSNLSSITNRILVMMGYQPICTEVSCRKSNYGNPWRRELKPAGHIRDFTLRALVDLVTHNGFRVDRIMTTPIAARQPLVFLEGVLGAISPHFGGEIILRCVKK